MQRKYGFAPNAFSAYIRACFRAGINPDRVSQTIGNAPASAGYHKKDGVVIIDGVKYDYCAATDIGVRDSDYDFLSDKEIKALLTELGKEGFAAWYRNWPGNKHIHMVYCGLAMKSQLRGQVHDYLNKKSGLAGNKDWEDYWLPPQSTIDFCRSLFLKFNPMLGDALGAEKDSFAEADLEDYVEFWEGKLGMSFEDYDSTDDPTDNEYEFGQINVRQNK